ncbi:MAG: TonB-dependent receptor, partial [Bacteroidota bacterium]
GGGAIAGLVNLVSKQPNEHPELSLMLNQTSAGGSTLNGFYAQKYGKTGASLFVTGHRQDPFDPNDDGFSDIPEVRSLTVSPRFFWYPNEQTTLWVGLNGTFENRVGGDIEVIDGNPGPDNVFSEENLSTRLSSQISFERQYDNGDQFRIRNSINFFDREINVPDFRFVGEQVASFTEVSYLTGNENSQWTFGANLVTDNFVESATGENARRDYKYTTVGGFVQNTFDLNEIIAVESGLRIDHNLDYGTFVLPRLNVLFKINPALTARMGGGLGYQLPSLFTEEAEARTFRGIRPISVRFTDAERSTGGNFDINYTTGFGDEVTFSINQFFFYTRLQDALVLEPAGGSLFEGQFFLGNANGSIDSRGFETNIKTTYKDFKLFLQYAFVDAQLNYDNINNQKPLTPRHTAGAILVFEQHGKWRIGLESYYTGQQFRSDFSKTRDFWIVGLMGLRQFKQWSVFLNFENFIDSRQSRYEDIVLPPFSNPSFAEIWAPLDGFVVNGGFIFNLFEKEEEHHHHH